MFDKVAEKKPICIIYPNFFHRPFSLQLQRVKNETMKANKHFQIDAICFIFCFIGLTLWVLLSAQEVK